MAIKKKVTKKVSTTKPMMVSIVLDETGSMSVRHDQTISAFNEYVGSLKTTNVPVSVTLTKFNTDKVEVSYTDKALKDVPLLSKETYKPTACTNLYDAVGKTINEINSRNVEKDKSVLVVIITDGEENSSKEYTQQKVFDLIKEKQGKGWTFVFMGADQDAWVASSGLGIARGNTMSFSGTNVKGAMKNLSTSTVMYASSSARAGGMSSSSFFTGPLHKTTSTSTKRPKFR